MDSISLNGGDWLYKGYIGEDWLWRNSVKPVTRDVLGWNRAVVPGSVHNDLWAAGIIPDPYFEMNSLAIEWVPGRTWVYKKTFTIEPRLRGMRIQLVFEGVDYAARFFLNGKELGSNTGMFLPAVFEAGERLNFEEENLLAVVIDPAPDEQPQIGYTSRVYTQKTRMNYWWDFCPRMVHLGIWQDVYLRATGPARLDDVWVRPRLSADLKSAQIEISASADLLNGVETVYDVIVRAPGGEALYERSDLVPAGGSTGLQCQFDIQQPDLWWPNGSGPAGQISRPLYEAEVGLKVDGQLSDSRRVTFGIRKVEFAANEGTQEGDLPYTLVVNGRRQYIKGWNWVPMDVLYGVDQPEKRERLLRLAQEAGVNLLRVWGGGLIEKEKFYDACDQLGILVWQEFIQSSSGIDNVPSGDPAFIDLLVRCAEQSVHSRRNHPSLAVWCGGNELHASPYELCDERTPALAALSAAVRRLDPDRRWLPSSPAGGVFAYGIPQSEEQGRLMQDVHGPWEYQGVRGQYELYNRGRSLLHSEFGVEGLTNLRTLNRTISRQRQDPVSLSNPVWDHLGAWWVKESVWQEAFGGQLSGVEMVQRATQFLQASGLGYALEADRRRAFQNAGTLPWQFNEPYPMAACTSAVDYYAEPKPLYYNAARAYRPLAVTARFNSIVWGGEAQFEAEIWCAFDEQPDGSPEQAGQLAVRVVGMDGQVYHDEAVKIQYTAGSPHPVSAVRLPLEPVRQELFFLDLSLQAGGTIAAENRYLFSKRDSLAPMLTAPVTELSGQVEKNGADWLVMLENTGRQAALWVWLEAEKKALREPEYAYFGDNYFCLLPGEQRKITIRWENLPEARRAVRAAGWNTGTVRLR